MDSMTLNAITHSRFAGARYRQTFDRATITRRLRHLRCSQNQDMKYRLLPVCSPTLCMNRQNGGNVVTDLTYSDFRMNMLYLQALLALYIPQF